MAVATTIQGGEIYRTAREAVEDLKAGLAARVDEVTLEDRAVAGVVAVRLEAEVPLKLRMREHLSHSTRSYGFK
ncbi:hypothetical protein PC116_g32770 [Phytophthora cactorum]|nr:hypothetical protein PC116_g32770 [Phytophthora cactorum]